MKYPFFIFVWLLSMMPALAQKKRFEIGIDAVSIG
jgi:hypothetical protein